MKKVFYILTFFFTILFANAQTEYEWLVTYDVNYPFSSSNFSNTIYEGCTDTIVVTISRPEGLGTGPITIPYQLTGDAVLGQDYDITVTTINDSVQSLTLQDTLLIPAGNSDVKLEILTIYDEVIELDEAIHLELDSFRVEIGLTSFKIMPDTIILPIVDQPKLNLDVTSDFSIHCPGDDALLEAELSGGVGGLMMESNLVEPYSSYSYVWSQIGSVAIQIENPMETTEYCVEEATDVCHTQILDACVTVTVPVYSDIVAKLDTTFVCTDIEGELCVDVEGGEGTYSYLWSNENASTDSCLVDSHDVYNVTVTDLCRQDIVVAQGEIYLDEAPNPIFEHLVIPHENLGMEFNNYTPNTIPGLTYFWNFGDGYGAYLRDPFHVFDEAGVYDVRLQVITEIAGCKKEYSDYVTVDPHYYFYAPNAFTPNNDAINDYFKPMVTGTRMYELFVYDSFGKLVFNTTDVLAEWDGTYNGKPAAEGTYVYKAVMTKELDVVIFEENGRLTLLR